MGWASGLGKLHSGDAISAFSNNALVGVGSMGYGGAAMAGAGIGAVAGGINGGMSYDGTLMGGAFRGAAMGAGGGAAFRFAGGTYLKGMGGAGGMGTKGREAYMNSGAPGGPMFNMNHFSSGWKASS